MSDGKQANKAYDAACRRLLEQALFSGDGAMLKDIKIVMDHATSLSNVIKKQLTWTGILSMTEAEVQQAEERAEKATPGPWEHATDYLGDGVFQERVGGFAIIRSIGNTMKEANRLMTDADFIAHSRADVPALCAEIWRLKKVIIEGEPNVSK